jgi:multidrug transporter EmrE-like cation transporter
MNTLTIAIVSIALSVAAQFSLKAGMSSEGVRAVLAQSQTQSLRTLFAVLSNGYVLGGFLLYGLGAVVWLGVLSKWDVSKAYPLVGLGFVLTVAIGFLLGEQVSLPRVIGVGLICAGVFLVGRS